MPNVYEKFNLGALYYFLDFQKGTFGALFSRNRPHKNDNPELRERPCRDPAFHKTIVITVPLGPTGLKKIILSMEMCSFSVCSCFFYVFVIHFPITLFQQKKRRKK